MHDLVFCLFGVHWLIRKKLVELLECWKEGFANHRSVDVWGAMPHCVMRTIWRERDLWTFDGIELLSAKIVSFAIHV